MNITRKDYYMIIEMPSRFSPDVEDQKKIKIPSNMIREGKKFVIDMKNTPNIFSYGLGFISHLYKEITDNKCKMYIANANPEVIKVLKTMNIDKMIPVFATMIDFELEDGFTREN